MTSRLANRPELSRHTPMRRTTTSTNIAVSLQPSPAELPVEVVERKGLGHPDTLADALAERMSVAYSRHCQQVFGAVLHHNLDKLYLQGGHAHTDLGVFEMKAPVTLIIGGRVSTCFGGERIDHRGLFEDVARGYLSTVLPSFDQARWLRIEHLTTDRSRPAGQRTSRSSPRAGHQGHGCPPGTARRHDGQRRSSSTRCAGS